MKGLDALAAKMIKQVTDSAGQIAQRCIHQFVNQKSGRKNCTNNNKGRNRRGI